MSKEETKKPEDAKMEEEAKKQENPEASENPPAATDDEKKGFFYKAGYNIGKAWNSKPAKKIRKGAKILAFGGICFGSGYAAGKGEIPFVGGHSSDDNSNVVDSTATDVTGSDEN